jgi:hypothetical protein
MIPKSRHAMLQTKILLVIILILLSAVAVEASVYFGIAMPGQEFMTMDVP